MKKEFWLQKWKDNHIAFHMKEANPLLIKHLPALSLPDNARIFIPLCGKTLDVGWLASKGYNIVGAELCELAIGQLFAELGQEPEISQIDGFKHYRAPNIDIFQGDFFDLTQTELGAVDAVYDRAALIALPKDMRLRYGEHLANITNSASQLLITLEYEDGLIEGPPFSVPDAEVYDHYQHQFNISQLANIDIPNGLKGKWPAIERVYHLKAK